MLNNITRDEVPREGRKRLNESDKHCATHFTIGASYWQQSYQSSNNYIQKKHYGESNENFRTNRCERKKREPQIDFNYAKRYKTQQQVVSVSEQKDQFDKKELKVRQPLHTYQELMKTNNYLGKYQPDMQSTSHQQFKQSNAQKMDNICYTTKNLTNYDIVTNNGKSNEHIMKENAFERFYPNKKMSRQSQNQTNPHKNFVMNDIVANRELPYIRPQLLKQINNTQQN